MDRSADTALTQWQQLQGLGKKPGTRKYHGEIAATLRAHWPAPLETPLRDHTTAHIIELAQRLDGFSPSRWNGLVSCLHAVLPATRILKRRRHPQQPPRIPGQLEFSQLLTELDRRPRSPHAGLFFRFLACTGMRITEARALEWKHVAANTLELPAAATKNGRPRSVPILAELRTVLDELRTITGAIPFVLPRQVPRHALDRAAAAVGLTVSFHDFRHYFATRCIESGADVPTVARWMGHMDGGALLQKTYFHLMDSHSLAAAAKVTIQTEPANILSLPEPDTPHAAIAQTKPATR